jgi:serine O-acetyltransferase
MISGRATVAGRRRELIRALAKGQPHVAHAVAADTRIACAYKGTSLDKATGRRIVLEAARLALTSDAFFALVLYRCKVHLRARGVPILPLVLHRLAMVLAQICIGDLVRIEPGIYIPHGQVVIDGIVTIGASTTIRPWVTIGLIDGMPNGPNIGRNVSIGTGAKILGPLTVGNGALIGANAVVVRDVPPRRTAVGVPARLVDIDTT